MLIFDIYTHSLYPHNRFLKNVKYFNLVILEYGMFTTDVGRYLLNGDY